MPCFVATVSSVTCLSSVIMSSTLFFLLGSVEAVRGRPLRGWSWKLVFPSLKYFTHHLTPLAPMHTSPYTRWSLWWVPVAWISSLTKIKWRHAEETKHCCRPFCITCLWSRDASYCHRTSLKDMKIVDGTYQTILKRLMLQSCQLCDVAHDFRYDPSTSN